MSDPGPEKEDAASQKLETAEKPAPEDERMEDEEKILAGRHDINYPALLTKDVPGG